MTGFEILITFWAGILNLTGASSKFDSLLWLLTAFTINCTYAYCKLIIDCFVSLFIRLLRFSRLSLKLGSLFSGFYDFGFIILSKFFVTSYCKNRGFDTCLSSSFVKERSNSFCNYSSCYFMYLNCTDKAMSNCSIFFCWIVDTYFLLNRSPLGNSILLFL